MEKELSITKSRGISLVALVITIIVLVVLAGAVILTLMSDDNVLKKSEEAVFKNNVKTFMEDFTMQVNNEKLRLKGNFNEKDINASSTIGNIEQWIPSITKEFKDKLKIESGKIVADGTKFKPEEIEWLKQLGIQVEGESTIDEPTDSAMFTFTTNATQKTAQLTGINTDYLVEVTVESTTASTQVFDHYTVKDKNGQPVSKLVLPGKITVDGQEYTVNEIGANAFADVQIDKLVIPQEITSFAQSSLAFRIHPVEIVINNFEENTTSIKNSGVTGDQNLIWTKESQPTDQKYFTYTVNTTTNTATITGINPDYKITDMDQQSEYFVIKDNIHNIVIPNTIKDSNKEYKVTEIGAEAFKEVRSIRTLIIPEGVTTIGEGAFLNMKGCDKIILPRSIESVGTNAFSNAFLANSFYMSAGTNLVLGTDSGLTTTQINSIVWKKI